MTLPAVLPHPRDMLAGWRATRLLLRLRWRLVRGRTPRVLVWIGLGLLLAVLFLTSEVGYFIRRVAEDGAGTPAAQFAVNYIVALDHGALGAVGATALGSAAAAALFSPFTGAANTALVSADDLATLRPHRLHRYFDSLLTAAVSSIGFLQLFALTGVASLLTLNGNRVGGLLLTWAVWPVLLLVAQAEVWAVELVQRSRGPKARRLLGTGLLAVVGAAVLLDPQHGKTLFGLGTAYSHTLHPAAGQPGTILPALILLAAVALVAFLAGIGLCQVALAHPAVPTTSGRARSRRLPLARHPRLALLQVLTVNLLRTGEIRRPLLTLLVLGVPAAWLAGNAQTTMSTLVMAIPLAVGLVWGANAFGIIGPGMTWLAAQPRALRWLLPATLTVQVGTVAALAVLIWLPPTLFGVVHPGDVAAVAAGLAVSTALISRSAATKSVRKPMLTRLGARGDVLMPPLRAMNLTLRFAVWGGQIGVLALNQHDRWLQVTLVTAVLCWTGVRLLLLHRRWRDRDVQARVIATVAAA